MESSRLADWTSVAIGLAIACSILVLPAAARAELGPMTGVTRVATGPNHACALSWGGAVRCWGRNDFGALGNGYGSWIGLPDDGIAVRRGATRIAAGLDASCAVVEGSLQCWGSNYDGLLGDGQASAYRTTATLVPDLATGVADVVAGPRMACALLDDGAVKCWGRNSYGELGDGSTTDRTLPTAVVGLGSGVTAITATGMHACVLTAIGQVKCWGANFAGQLGDGTTENRPTPVLVQDLGDVAIDIVAGTVHSCALLLAGKVKCWGDGSQGQIGNGSRSSSPTPIQGPQFASAPLRLQVGGSTTCAIGSDDSLRCWGGNDLGQQGTGGVNDVLTPRRIPGFEAGARHAAPGIWSTCAARTDGTVSCWGANWHGQLGDRSRSAFVTATAVAGPMTTAIRLSTGDRHACALGNTGGLKCWGANTWGEVGDGSTTLRTAPVDVAGMTSGVVDVSAGFSRTCAIKNGAAYCWGRTGSTIERLAAPVPGLETGTMALAVGGSHACALRVGGGVQCWGENNSGQLGDGTMAASDLPVDASGLASGVIAIGAGNTHACALKSNGTVWCWGTNAFNVLGDGTTDPYSAIPRLVSGISSATAMSIGPWHACVIVDGGALKCWGLNSNGQLGDGTSEPRLAPVTPLLGFSTAVSVSAGGFHTCVVLSNGAAYCWGTNFFGELGEGTGAPQVLVPGLVNATSVHAGHSFTCALGAGEPARCFGLDQYGTLGDGGRNFLAPADVIADEIIFVDTFE